MLTCLDLEIFLLGTEPIELVVHVWFVHSQHLNDVFTLLLTLLPTGFLQAFFPVIFALLYPKNCSLGKQMKPRDSIPLETTFLSSSENSARAKLLISAD